MPTPDSATVLAALKELEELARLAREFQFRAPRLDETLDQFEHALARHIGEHSGGQHQ